MHLVNVPIRITSKSPYIAGGEKVDSISGYVGGLFREFNKCVHVDGVVSYDATECT